VSSRFFPPTSYVSVGARSPLRAPHDQDTVTAIGRFYIPKAVLSIQLGQPDLEFPRSLQCEGHGTTANN
jgi:hypothetical protein